MSWGRAKTILIVLFLIIDILLLSLLIYMDNKENNITDKNIDEAVMVLQNHGITIRKEAIPKKREKNISLEMKESFESSEAAAERLLGSDYNRETAAEDSIIYKKEDKILKISGNEFEFKNSRKIVPVQREEEAVKALKRELKSYGYRMKNYDIKCSGINNGICYFKVYCKYGGVKIVGNELSVAADNDGILNMNGKFISVSETETVYGKLMDVTAVLCNIIYDNKYDNMVIKNVEFTYYTQYDGIRNKTSANPAYMITAENCEKHYITDITQK